MLDEVTVLPNGTDIVVVEAHPAADALTAGLQGSAAAPEDDDISPHLIHHIAVADFEPVTDGNHEDDGSDAPRDAEHGKGAAQFVRPDVAKGLNQDLEEEPHGNTSLSPSFNPSVICVRWPLEMPSLTGTLRQPCLLAGASNCAHVLLSWS